MPSRRRTVSRCYDWKARMNEDEWPRWKSGECSAYKGESDAVEHALAKKKAISVDLYDDVIASKSKRVGMSTIIA